MWWLWLIGILFVALILWFRIVPPKEADIVLRLGDPVRVKRQWFHFLIPFIETTKRQVVYDRNLGVSVDGLTRDNVKTRVGINVIFRVQDTDDAIIASKFSIDDPVRLVQATVDEQLRAKIFTFEHEDIFGKREEIGDEVRETLRVKLGQYGMELDSVQVTDIALDESVMQAMNKIIEEEKKKQALVREAEWRKAAVILDAEADRAVKKLIWEGMALQRMEIAKWFKESVAEMQWIDKSLTAAGILDFLIVSSRLETLEKVGKDNAKIVYLNENLEGKMTTLVGAWVEMMKGV